MDLGLGEQSVAPAKACQLSDQRICSALSFLVNRMRIFNLNEISGLSRLHHEVRDVPLPFPRLEVVKHNRLFAEAGDARRSVKQLPYFNLK
ncbi:hypothetical protein Xvtw_16495 [Xanthomonas campestris pv. vitiswoodrowii]|nr:hypothetical protein Xvtw_16495 [Xanthomonas campestris pv. vitiswoodrowii]